MGEDTVVTKTISDLYPTMSKSHKRVAEYVLDNRHDAAFLTLEQLASKSNVSRSTAERFAHKLGFEGFPDFRRSLANLIRESLNPIEKIQLGASKPVSPSAALHSVVAEDLNNLESTLELISNDQLTRVIEMISRADRVVVSGSGSSYYLSGLFAFRLGTFRENVIALDASEEQAFRYLNWMGENDCFIAISMPRYSRITIDHCRHAKRQSMMTIGITDKMRTPLHEVCDQVLVSRSERELLVSSPTAVVSLIDAIVTTIAISNEEKSLLSMKALYQELQEANIHFSPPDYLLLANADPGEMSSKLDCETNKEEPYCKERFW